MEVKPKKNRRFSDEFREEAIELAKTIGNSKAAKELGIHESSIRIWRKKLEGPADKQMNKSKKSYAEIEKEIKRLQKENGYLKEINKVLKKSTAIFSADLMGNSK